MNGLPGKQAVFVCASEKQKMVLNNELPPEEHARRKALISSGLARGLTLKQMGAELNVGAERVRQLIRKYKLIGFTTGHRRTP